MKRKILIGVLTVALTLTSSICYGENVAFARGLIDADGNSVTEHVKGDAKIEASELFNDFDSIELRVGDAVEYGVAVVDANGNGIDDIEFASLEEVKDLFGADERFYTEYDDVDKANMDKNKVGFDNTIPKEAFGKYVYRWGMFFYPDGFCLKLIRSTYKITSLCGTDYTSFCLNDDNKSVTVFTIENQNFGFNASFPTTVKENGKTYKVTDIGANALENGKGTGMKAVTIHSGIKTIGENAFAGAKNLKTITIKSNLKSVGKNAFKGINKKAVFKIKASDKNYKNIVFKIKQSGVAKTVKFKRIK